MQQYNNQLLSYRQTAEWGMRGIQGTFGRLRIPLRINYNNLRADLLESCVRLYNFRTQSIGHNQIRTVYMEVWSAEEQLWLTFENVAFAEQTRNDRVRKFYMIFGDDL